jgi:propanol-preferring alcohol dehydrogenase
MTAHELGFRTIAVDLSETRLQLASRLGADAVVNARETDTVAAVKQLTDGVGVEATVECSGADVAQANAIRVGAPLGQVILVGNGKPDANLPIGVLKAKEMVMQGSVVFHSQEYPGMLDFLTGASFSLADLVEDELPIERAAEAFARADRADAGKILFSW